MKIRVTASTDSVRRKLRGVERKTEAPDENYKRGLRRMAQRYRSFLFNRFDRFSRGGGNWKSTKRRKSSKGKRKPFILRISHTLMRALSPIMRGLPGQYERIKGNTIETGYGGNAKHPDSSLSVKQLAVIHQKGTARIAARPIIVRPDARTRELMISDIERSIK